CSSDLRERAAHEWQCDTARRSEHADIRQDFESRISRDRKSFVVLIRGNILLNLRHQKSGISLQVASGDNIVASVAVVRDGEMASPFIKGLPVSRPSG